MVADGEGPQVQALLLRRFRGSASNQNESAQPARTAAQLWQAAGARRTLREEAEARARRDGHHKTFTVRFLQLRSRRERKPSLQERFDKAGFPRHS
jgi:hypothetical protein